MSKERIKISEDLFDIMPSDYQDLVRSATYGKEDRGWKDIGNSKELIEQHSLCAGCPESMAFRYILASLPNPEDTVMVGSTGCTSLVFPMVAVHNIHSLFGNQNAIASGLKRALSVRFPGRTKDVVVLAGDGATVDIGLDMTLQAWFRQEKFTTICFDNELYANTGGQESGLMQKGFVAKMAPVGKLFDKVRLPEIARESGCHYVISCTVSKPSLVEKVVRNAVMISGRTAWRDSRKCGILKNRPSGSRTRNLSVSQPKSSWQSWPPRTRKRRPLQNSLLLREPNPILKGKRP
jgi:pyruvate ferredoxin oxidoreductase beta subunit